MKITKTKTRTRTYSKSIRTPFFVLKDEPTKEDINEIIEPTVQMRFMNDMVGRFLKVFIKLYSKDELSDGDRDKLRRYLEKIIDAKDAVTPREPKGGMYLKKF